LTVKEFLGDIELINGFECLTTATVESKYAAVLACDSQGFGVFLKKLPVIGRAMKSLAEKKLSIYKENMSNRSDVFLKNSEKLFYLSDRYRRFMKNG
jgi:hypothetical protein